MKLGVFGGTFDPIHVGHLMIAEEVRGRLGLDEVLFVPAGQPRLKSGRQVTEAPHRLTMVKLAIAGNPHFRVSDMEIKRQGPSYSAETLDGLRQDLNAGGELYFIAGLDALRELDRWYQPRRVIELGTLVGVARPECQELARAVLESILPGASGDVVVIRGPLVGISGTEIRRRVSRGMSIRYQVPEPVEGYIYEHRLYRGSAGTEGS